MPYIKIADRQRLEGSKALPKTAGELNYVITKIVRKYIGSEYNYQSLNEVIGVLECAKLELYRRVVARYEDIKRQENGDVF